MPLGAKVIDCGPRLDAEKNATEMSAVNKMMPNAEGGVPETVECFLSDITLHGVRYLFAKSTLRRFLWSLALLASLGYCYYQTYQSSMQYLRRPFNTKITSKSANYGGLIFPAVTLCNFNPLNMKKMRNLLSTPDLRNDELEKRVQEVSKILIQSTDAITAEFQDKYRTLFNRDTYVELLKTAGHQMDEMLLPNVTPMFISCSFDGLSCGADNFSSFVNSFFGKCFTFNSGKDGKPPLKAIMTGKNHGLRLHMNIQRDSYIKNAINPFAGITVLVHDQDNYPFIYEHGFGVPPGVHTFSAIKMKKTINLPEPYETKCIHKRLNAFNSNASYAYSKPACIMQCTHDFIMRKCGCRLLEFQGKAPICGPNDTLLCVVPALRAFSLSKGGHKCEDDCPKACHHVDYETSLTYAKLQRNVFVEQFLSFLNATPESPVSTSLYEVYLPLLNMTRSERQEYIDDNIVSLDIYFGELYYDEIEQIPGYELWIFLGGLGGNFGLFVGMSILTVCEFLDYGIRKIYHKIFSGKRNER